MAGETLTHAFFFDGSKLVDLGTLGGGNSSATGLNDAGDVVGSAQTAGGESHAFVWTQALGLADIGAASPAAINNAGQVVGGAGRATGSSYGGPLAFSWTPTSGFVDIGALLWSGHRSLPSIATAVNDAGQVIGTLGGDRSDAVAVNQDGTVIGNSFTADGAQHAFIWQPGTGIVDLGTLGGTGSTARAINAAGQVAGFLTTAPGEQHGFVWSAAEGLLDLNDVTPGKPAGLTINDVIAIADNGHIVASSRLGLVLLRRAPASAHAPVIGAIAANDPLAVNSTIEISAAFTDADAGDTHLASLTWGDGSAPQVASATGNQRRGKRERPAPL